MINKSDYIKKHGDELKSASKDILNYEFNNFCKTGNLEIVKYLLVSPELKEHADINAENSYGFRNACFFGHLEIVQYLLTSPDLKEHADIHAENNYGFRWACQKGNLEVVKYLLTSPDLKEHVNIHFNNAEWFKESCRNNDFGMIRYFIFDFKIEKTKTIENFINQKHYRHIEDMFELRELNKKLEQDLKENNSTIKKIKL